MGKPLEEFSKDELIEIIVELARMQKQDWKNAAEERERLFNMMRK